MLNKLNIKQKKLKGIVKNEWVDNLTTQKFDKDKIIKGVELLYSITKLKKPKTLILKSPFAIQLAANLLNKKEVRQEVGQEVRQEVRQEVGQEVGQEVRQEVEREVGQEVRQEVEREVGQEVSQKKLKFYSFGCFLSTWYYDWFSFYDFFSRIGIIKNEKFNILMEAVRSGIYETIQLSGYCLVSLPPVYVKKQNGRMHSTNSSAIKWEDGYELFYINGVRFEKELFEKLTQGKMSFEEILSIEDVDQRNQALRFVGNDEKEKFLKHVKAKVLDKYQKTSSKGNKVNYKLYKIPSGDIFSEDTFVMWYECPSTGLQNFSGVPESKTVAEAMAWKMSDDNHTIKPEEWKSMIPLLDEA